MTKLILTTAFGALFFALQTLACQLPVNSELVIGCTRYECKSTYLKALEQSAARLGYNIRIQTLRTSTFEYDGVLSPGGHDILPQYYIDSFFDQNEADRTERLYSELGTTCNSCKRRDAFEFDFFSKYRNRLASEKQPVLGICYGMQMWSVVTGHTLYVDIKKQLGIENRYTSRGVGYDSIELERDWSKIPAHFVELHAKLENSELKGFESHHQGIDMNHYRQVGESSPIVVAGTSHQGRIGEVIYSKTEPVLGVQFHPEVSGKSPKLKAAVFDWFLKSACEHKMSKN